jgi:uncharacterized protein
VSERVRAVFDCNVFLQAMLSARGPANACWQKVLAGEVALVISPYVLAEVRRLPYHRRLSRFSQFTFERVERFVEALLDAAELVDDPEPSFVYARDPQDAHYVDLAIASGAFLVVSNDRDLLDLMSDTNAEGTKLRAAHPAFQVLTPPDLLRRIEPPATGVE